MLEGDIARLTVVENDVESLDASKSRKEEESVEHTVAYGVVVIQIV